jgi:hypothetical protein
MVFEDKGILAAKLPFKAGGQHPALLRLDIDVPTPKTSFSNDRRANASKSG